VSWRFESIVNLATVYTQQHDTRRPGGHHEWQQFITWPKSGAGSYPTLVRSSTHTHMPRWTHNGWPEHYPIVHLWSEVRYCPPHRHTKLLSFRVPYVPYASIHFKCLFIQTQPMQALTDTGGGYHLGASNFRSDHSYSFASSILRFPIIGPPSLKLNHSINYSSSPHSNHEPGYKSPKSHEWNLPRDFYRSSIH
jgi:hypothetical protein